MAHHELPYLKIQYTVSKCIALTKCRTEGMENLFGCLTAHFHFWSVISLISYLLYKVINKEGMGVINFEQVIANNGWHRFHAKHLLPPPAPD